MLRVTVPEYLDTLKTLKAGDEVLLSGIIYTARDQAHKRLAEIIARKGKLPFDLAQSVVYYCGPTDTPPGRIIGSCGPTTSRRMDEFTPLLLSRGLKAMIGKGGRGSRVREAIRRHRAVYFTAFAGCGALCSRYVVSKKLCAFKDLGPEAVFRLQVKDFPLITAIDSAGRGIRAEFVR
jgi:fumarate hydratase subunit beta